MFMVNGLHVLNMRNYTNGVSTHMYEVVGTKYLKYNIDRIIVWH